MNPTLARLATAAARLQELLDQADAERERRDQLILAAVDAKSATVRQIANAGRVSAARVMQVVGNIG